MFGLVWGFGGRHYIRLDQIKMAACSYFEKFKRPYLCNELSDSFYIKICIYTDHTLPSDTIITVQLLTHMTGDWTVDTYLAKESKLADIQYKEKE